MPFRRESTRPTSGGKDRPPGLCDRAKRLLSRVLLPAGALNHGERLLSRRTSSGHALPLDNGTHSATASCQSWGAAVAKGTSGAKQSGDPFAQIRG